MTSPWILLDTEARTDDDRQNATTAASRTSTGHHIQATLVAADPPRDSYFCVHVPGLTDDAAGRRRSYPILTPRVDCTGGRLALLSVRVSRSSAATDYFVYRAGRRPKLQLLPGVCSDKLESLNDYGPIGLVPRGDDGEHFVLAALRHKPMPGEYDPDTPLEEAYDEDDLGASLEEAYDEDAYELLVFQSERRAWAKHTLVFGGGVDRLDLEKAIALGGGELGWVDLCRAILVVDVLAETPKHRVIPLPKLLPVNQKDSFSNQHPWARRRSFRDVVVCADGSIRCVELEHCKRRAEIPDVSAMDVLHDAELPVGRYANMPRHKYEYHGWRVITWTRAVASTCWRKVGLVHVDDILAGGDPGHTAALLLREIGRDLTVRHLLVEVPSLSLDGDDDIVYFMCKAEQRDTKTWVIAVDMGKKTLEEVVPISVEHLGSTRLCYLSCALSKHLNTD
ncbi:hypothetical protein ACP70R_013575 [Stipagrostis hirtigluma subsp. patula]